jgi:hypothetical protein
MKTYFLILLAGILALTGAAQTSVQFSFTDPAFGISQTTNRYVILQAETGPSLYGNSVLLPFRLTGYTDTNGQITFSNLSGSQTSGYYHWTVPAPPQMAQGDIWVSSTNLGLVSATLLQVAAGSPYPPGAWSWTAYTSDQRYTLSTNNYTNFVTYGYLNVASNGIVSLFPGITNGYTSIVYSNPASYATPAQVTNIVNNIAQTNAGVTLVQVTNVAFTVSSNALYWVKQPASATLTNLASTGAFTNGLTAGQNFSLTTNVTGTIIYLNATNQTFLTNGFTGIVFANSNTIVFTNQLYSLTNGFVGRWITNGLVNFPSATNVVLSVADTNGAAIYWYSLSTNFAKTNQPTLIGYVTNGQTGVTLTGNFFGPGAGITNIPTTNLNGLITASVIGSPSFNGSGLTNLNYNNITNPPVLPTNNFVAGQNVTLTTNFTGSLTYINATNQTFLTNGLASVSYVNSVTNGFVTASITNGLASASVTNGLATIAYVNAATNGFVTASITNGLVGPSITNGFVTASITNGFASTNYVNTATNGFVTSLITNGLAGTSLVYQIGSNGTNYANALWISSSNYVNLQYLYATNYAYTNLIAYADTNGAGAYQAKLATNGYGSVVYYSYTNFTTPIQVTNIFYSLTSGLATNSTISTGQIGMSVASVVNGTNFWVNDKGGGVFVTNHIP